MKPENFRLLIVGGGKVALEKLSVLMSHAPAVKVTVVAREALGEIKQLADSSENISLIQKEYEVSDLENADLVIVAVNDIACAGKICKEAHCKKLLVNVADTPDLCDFYLSSIVKKGNLKIAISTNGKSPTLGKRLKEILNNAIPEEIDTSLEQLNLIRNQLAGDFDRKVRKLNELTKIMTEDMKEKKTIIKPAALDRTSFWKKVALLAVIILASMFVGYFLLSAVLPANWVKAGGNALANTFNEQFIWMFIAGFAAQLVDGAMGMGYGVLATTFLLSSNLPIPIAGISSSVHMAEMFSVGTAGISHYKYKHVNKKLWVALVIPGIIGAVAGAVFIGTMGKSLGNYLRPVVSIYTFYLGFKIFQKAFKNYKEKNKTKLLNVRPVALIGGFLDAFGGGWGPLVTSTLISGGRDPLYTIGSSTFTKFFTSIASTATFVIVFHQMHFQLIAGLIIGGVLAAPLAAKLSGKIPLKTMFIAVGILVILCSLKVLYNFFDLMF
ncbi:MAG: TSUP family transporter [Arachidicoccus sp.]|nr:TSUP family transporter [Arachidicoccus sp.]